MSRENVESLRRGYGALHRGDRVFEGFGGTQEWISDIRQVWESFQAAGRGG
jgi:hypothetical protein